MDEPELRAVLAEFCAAPGWINRVAAARPFVSADAVLQAADAAMSHVPPDEWRQAFLHHPRIGEQRAARALSNAAQASSSREQSGVQQADAADVAAIAAANRAYEERFGHVFLVRAAGRSAKEILAILNERLKNDPDREIAVAADEHRQITRLRLERLLK
jgi:OHCU decarboxylase